MDPAVRGHVPVLLGGNPALQGELARRRDAIRDAMADTLERVAAVNGFALRFPLNGLAFERSADPDALPDEVFAEFVTAVLGCAIAAPA